MMHPRRNSGFTLIELLVVIAIIAILAVVVVLTLNPAQLLAQSRDSERLSDMATLVSAINLYNTDQAGTQGYSLGSASTSYISISDSSATSTAGDQCQGLLMATTTNYSYQCASSSNYRGVNARGWLPINLANITAGSPISSLPVDPVNQSSSNLYYSYETNGSTYELSSFFESTKYAAKMGSGGGVDAALYQQGTGLSNLSDLGRGLAGFWPLNEGTGLTGFDWSGNGENGVISAAGTWGAGQVYASALTIASATSVTYPTSTMPMPTSAFTISAWVNLPSFVNNLDVLYENWASAGGYILLIPSSGKLQLEIYTTSAISIVCPTVLSTATWNDVVGVYNGTSMQVYLNGVLCASNSLVGASLTSPTVLKTATLAGQTASLNDVRLYNRALSAAEIQEMYNAEL